MKSKIIWVLQDHLVGNSNQSLALAQSLGLPLVIKKITYNKFSFLPSIITRTSLIDIDKKNSDYEGTYPDIIISSGRRLANLARYIKRKNPSTKIINILWPEINIKEFDLIILPYHDKYEDRYGNIIRINGALSKISASLIDLEQEKWQKKFSALPKPIIAVLIGGNTKKGKFSEYHASSLIEKCNNFAKTIGGSLVISTSRRTDIEIIDKIRKLIDVPNFFYDYTSKEENPYLGFLAIAKLIIATGDSISMCSDVCSTGKPVYIFYNDEFVPAKHQRFLEDLFEKNYAKNFAGDLSLEPWGNLKLLNNMEEISKIIRDRFL